LGEFDEAEGVAEGADNASAKELRLYVNGQRVAVVGDVTAWEAAGGLQIGRSKVTGIYSHYWPGDVDDIKILQQAVSDSDASELAQNTTPAGTTVRAHWKLDEVAGSRRVYGETGSINAVPSSGVSLGVDGQVATAARFNGSTGYVATDRPVIDTSKSFTVSAWAKLAPGAETKNMSVVSQEGNTMSGFTLKFYPGTQKWQLLSFNGDIDDVKVFDRVVTAEEAKELYNLRPVLKGRWKLNTNGADNVENGHPLAFGGAAHIDPEAGFKTMSSGGLNLNGPGSYAQTSVPVLDTAQSFTVSAWVQAAGRPTGKATVLSQARTGSCVIPLAPSLAPTPQPRAATRSRWPIPMRRLRGGRSPSMRVSPRAGGITWRSCMTRPPTR
jgi:hypothetical protein